MFTISIPKRPGPAGLHEAGPNLWYCRPVNRSLASESRPGGQPDSLQAAMSYASLEGICRLPQASKIYAGRPRLMQAGPGLC
jgi:hypothetical protein